MARPPPPAAGGPGVSQQQLNKLGKDAFDRSEKISADLFAITYGSMVVSLINDANAMAPQAPIQDRIAKVNAQLQKIGIRIGQRIIDEFLAKAGVPQCKSFISTGEIIARVALKMFLNISTATVDNVVQGTEGETYSIIFEENPLNGYAELTEPIRSLLWYSNVLCGVVEGALEQLQMKVTVKFVRDVLRGDSINELRVHRPTIASPTTKK